MTFVVPGYQVGELLGFGSHGEVWQGRLVGNDAPVALKRIAVHDSATARAARSEAALLSALSHPHLIELREFVMLDGAVVLVLELADGGSLAELLRRRDRLTPAEVAASLSPIAAALAHAHDEGVLHGDVSASNVLFTAAGQPKLADLGVSRMFGTPDAAIGTPAYVDPVVAAGGAAGAASDVFSLAAVALHALTGRGPWQRHAAESADDVSADEALAQAATGIVDDLAARLSSYPEKMAEVLTRALDPEPHRRGTAAEFALDLRAATHHAPVVLSAGRQGKPVGKHAADRRGLVEPADDSTGRASRPAFARHRLAEPDRIPADLTHISRPRVRVSSVPPSTEPSITKPASTKAHGTKPRGTKPRGTNPASRGLARARLAATSGLAGLAGSLRRRSVQLVAVAALLVVGAAAVSLSGLVAMPGDHADAAARIQPSEMAQPPTGAAQILAELDSARSLAFAQRRPDLLAQVYTSPALLAQDAAQLKTRVPTGCSLTGLVTSYRDVVVTKQSVSLIELRALASLGAGELRCGTTSRGHTAGAGPTAMRLILAARPDGSFGISSLQLG
jgi:serine/threonine protein kinase